MRLIISILALLSLDALAQEATSLDELLKLVENTRLEELTPSPCEESLSTYKVEVMYLYEGISLSILYKLEIPSDYLDKENFCGYHYDVESFRGDIVGNVLNESLIIYLLPYEDHSSERLEFTTENSGVYIQESFGWEPYRKYEGTFRLLP